jgi:competence ComEA-like helix-hairpin-helix protein
MPTKIDINNADVKTLTQLPGVAKNLAYSIVNHRKRHGFFTQWEELLEVKGFPEKALPRIKERAVIGAPRDLHRGEEFTRQRPVKASTIERVKKKPRGYTRDIRTTRRADRQKPSTESEVA